MYSWATIRPLRQVPTMISPIALRTAFKEFLGKERFLKFVRGGCGSRLLFWQEKEWERFVAVYPHFNIPLADLAVALRICGVHDIELLPCEVEIFHGCLDISPAYMRERANRFPFATQDLVSTEGRQCDTESMPSWYCPKCREARAEYLACLPSSTGPRKPMA